MLDVESVGMLAHAFAAVNHFGNLQIVTKQAASFEM